MPTALVIAYYFPPMGGAGVQRAVKFVKYLPEFGWETHVLTAIIPPASLQDASLLDELHPKQSITHTKALLPPRFLPWRLRNLINRWLLTVDEQLGWYPFARSAGLRIIRQQPIEIIYSTSTPYTSHLVARSLKRKTGLPWVADFRDPWAENPMLHFPTAFHRQVNNHLERRVFMEADRVILNTDATRQHYLQKYPNLAKAKMMTITNGYDEADLAGTSQSSKANSVFTIVHLGSLYQKTRSSEFFLKALQAAIQSGEIPREKMRVRFIGNIDRETQSFVERFDLQGIVELTGYLPHRQSISHLFEADLLLLIPSYGQGANLFLPGKIFEYLASRRPILCLAEAGASADLITQTRAGRVVPPREPSQIMEQLVRHYQQWENRILNIEPDLALIASFERRKLTARLARLFDEVTRR